MFHIGQKVTIRLKCLIVVFLFFLFSLDLLIMITHGTWCYMSNFVFDFNHGELCYICTFKIDYNAWNMFPLLPFVVKVFSPSRKSLWGSPRDASPHSPSFLDEITNNILGIDHMTHLGGFKWGTCWCNTSQILGLPLS